MLHDGYQNHLVTRMTPVSNTDPHPKAVSSPGTPMQESANPGVGPFANTTHSLDAVSFLSMNILAIETASTGFRL